MSYNHRPLGPALGGRIPELLESLKAEFDTLAQDVGQYHRQKDDVEHKLNQQLHEMKQFQQTLFELEGIHSKIKQQYEEEIIRLRRELEHRIGASAQPASAQPPNLAFAQGFAGGLPPIDPQNGSNKRHKSEGAPLQMPQSLPQLQGFPGQPPQGLPFPQQLPPVPSAPAQGLPTPPQTLPSFIAPAPAPSPAPASAPVQVPALHQAPQSAQESQEKPKATFSLNDVDLETLPASQKKEGSDWLVVFNKQVQQVVDIDLASTMEHKSVVCCVKFSFDSKYLATGCNRTTHIFDVATGQLVGEFSDSSIKDGDLYIRSVCFSPDGQYLATGAEDRQIRVWDIKQNKIKRYFTGHEQDIYSLDFTHDGEFLCSGSGDKTVRVWSLETGKCVHTFGTDEPGSNKEPGVTSVAVSPDGKLLAAGSLDDMIRIWDAKSGAFLDKLEGHTDSVYAVSFSPDGKLLASGSLDRTLRIWEIGRQGQRSSCKYVCSGHKDFVLSVAFSPDGKWIISGSKDKTVQFWDPLTGVVQCMLQGHKNSVISVGVTPNALNFATGSGDLKARIWRCNPVTPSFSNAPSALAGLAGLVGLSGGSLLPMPTPPEVQKQLSPTEAKPSETPKEEGEIKQ